MKLSRLVYTALASTMICGWTTWSYACDDSKATAKATAASAKAGACTAEMAAKCTPEMAAACKAGMKATAVLASSNGACRAKGANAAAAVAMSDDHCGMAKVSAVAAGSGASCAAKGAAAMAAGAACASKSASAGAGQCNGHGMASMAAASDHAACEACLDMSDCSGALDAAGAHRQTVRLKNGIMYVYTADSPRAVSAVQAAVSRRAEHMTRLATAGDKARLCAECKAMRGAMASGKLNREVVNIEGGSLTLITSNDATVVAKIHAMTDQKVAARTKS
jgi:hypothetical protein